MHTLAVNTRPTRLTVTLLLASVVALLTLLAAQDTAYASFSPVGSAFIGLPEQGPDCFNDTDDDGDGKVNDGCAPSADTLIESGSECANNIDDDGDTLINDGCPPAGDTSPGVAAGLTTKFGVGLGPNNLPGPLGANNDDIPDINFGGLVGFTPNEWNVQDGSALPVGAIVGNLSSRAVLGLINGGCQSVLPVEFTFMNATTGGTEFEPKPPGSDDPLEFFLNDDDSNGIPNGVDMYPSYLNLLLDPDYDGPGPDGNPLTTGDNINGPKPPLVPKARYTGITYIASASTTVVLTFVVFEPGTTFETEPPIVADPSLGYPSVTILQDPTAPPDPGAITDFCSPLFSTTTFLGETEDNPATGANEGGIPFRVNPSDGAYNFVTYARSQRDADGDGHENGLDPCPFDPDPNWNPREVVSGTNPNYKSDNDFDGIPNSCDQEPDVMDSSFPLDVDNDAFLNRGDNCPQVNNPLQEDNDNDGIGDACDIVGAGGFGKGPDIADGDFDELCIVTELTIGSGGTAPSIAVPPCAAIPTVTISDTSTGDTGTGDTGTGDTGTGDTGTGDTGTGDTTDVAGQTTGPTGAGGIGGPDTGVGSLAPAIASIPAWAAIVSALGGAGLLGSLGALASRVLRRRR